MKIKLNFFRKILFFSLFIIVVTVFLNIFSNMFFLDKFYIYRQSEKMIEIAKEVKNFPDTMYKSSEMDTYIENTENRSGISIMIIPRPVHNILNKHHENDSGYTDSNIPNNTNIYINMGNSPEKAPHEKMKMGMGGMRMGRKRLYRNTRFLELHNQTFLMAEFENPKIEFLFYIIPLTDEKDLVLSTSLSAMSSYKHEIFSFNFRTTIISILISIIIGRIFAKKITKDLEKLNSVSKKIAVLDFSENIDIKRSDEIGELSESIKNMSKNLESAIENLKAFASNASHELKTPIAVINSHAQALTSGIIKDENDKFKYYRTILNTSSEMNDLVHNLLTISRLSAPGIKPDFQNVVFSTLIKESIEKYEFLELEKDISWNISKNEEFTAPVEEKLLKIAIDNLIQNSLKYSKENETVNVSIDSSKIYFENKFDGKISPENMEKLWEPFFRGENAKDMNIDGNGLGMAIIKMILELNNLNYKINIDNEKFIFIIKKT